MKMHISKHNITKTLTNLSSMSAFFIALCPKQTSHTCTHTHVVHALLLPFSCEYGQHLNIGRIGRKKTGPAQWDRITFPKLFAINGDRAQFVVDDLASVLPSFPYLVRSMYLETRLKIFHTVLNFPAFCYLSPQNKIQNSNVTKTKT